jgi:hypothetical protein
VRRLVFDPFVRPAPDGNLDAADPDRKATVQGFFAHFVGFISTVTILKLGFSRDGAACGAGLIMRYSPQVPVQLRVNDVV